MAEAASATSGIPCGVADGVLPSLEDRILAVLVADRSFEGLTAAAVQRLLEPEHGEHEVWLSLNKLVERQIAFNTLSDQRFAAL